MSQVSNEAGEAGVVGINSSVPRQQQLPIAKWLRSFGMFWWDFLVGDTPELFVGVVAVLLIVYGITSAGTSKWIEAIVTVALASLVLTASVARAIRSANKPGK